MQEERRLYRGFMELHSSKAATTAFPCVQVMFYKDTMGPKDPLVQMTRQDILDELDKESPLVRQMLRQVSTYDVDKQVVVGLVFDRKTVLSDVVWKHRGVDKV